MPLDSGTIQLLSTIAAPSGVLAVTLKVLLNGTKGRIKQIADDVHETKVEVKTLHVRVDAIELNQAREEGIEEGLRRAREDLARKT